MKREKLLRLETLESRQLLAADGAEIAADRFGVQQNATEQRLEVLANDVFDADYAGPKTITQVSQGDAGGRIKIAEGARAILYTPPADRAGTETFTYYVDEQHAGKVTIQIAAPLRDDTFTFFPDRNTYDLDVLENDPFWKDYEGARKITLTSASSRGADVEIAADGNGLVYTRRDHSYGKDRITYIVDDRYPATAEVNFVAPLKGDKFQLPEFGSPVTLNVIANDPFWRQYGGAKEVTHILDVPEGAQAAIHADGKSITFDFSQMAPGSYGMRYVVDGQYEAGISATVSRPVQDDRFTVDKGSTEFRVNLLKNDYYRSVHDYRQIIDVIGRITSLGPSEHGATITAADDGESILYTPPTDFVGTDTFTYLADEKHEATVTVNVIDPFDEDRGRFDHFQVFHGTVDNVLDVLANDFFGNGYTGPRQITGVEGLEGGEVRIAEDGKALLFTPHDEHQRYNFTYEIDGQLTGHVSVHARSLAKNDTYWFSRPGTHTLRVVSQINFPDTYVGGRRITAVEQPNRGGHVEISADGRSLIHKGGMGAETLHYTLDGKYEGAIRVAYRQRLNTDYAVVFQNSDEQAIDVLANDFDAHSTRRWGVYHGPREITHVESRTENGTVTISADKKQILFQPHEDFVGQESIRYVVDGFLEATVTIDVARLLRHDRLHAQPGETEVLDLLANDLVGGEYQGALRITNVTAGVLGAQVEIAPDGKSVRYTAPEGAVGADVFEYTVDGQLKATVTVELDAPSELYPKFASLDAFKQLVLENEDHHQGGRLGIGGNSPLEDADQLNFSAVKRDHSETNVQVEGVDEADLIETDSDHLYTLTDGQLVITQAWPADSLEVLSRAEIKGSPLGMYLHGDRLAVISQEAPIHIWHDHFLDGPVRDSWLPYPVGDPVTIVTVFDVSDRSNPQLVQRSEVEGAHVQTRRIDDMVYLVVRDRQSLVAPHKEICEGEGDERSCRVETPEERRARIENDFASVVEEILPSYQSFGADGTLARGGLLVQPEDIFSPISEGAASLVSVVAIDVTNSEPGLASTTGVLTTGASELYVTTKSLYVFEEQYAWYQDTDLADNPTTKILKFELTPSEGGVAFTSTGQVPGRMINQFSADENNGFLRIATTVSNNRTGNYSGSQENVLFVLADDGGVLESVGTLQNLALDENIQSVRFFGDRVMVTTFQNVDPLFSIDVSEPTNPHVEGFLTLPGFASYMQFVDENHLLTIGRNSAVGWGGQVAISLFHVADIEQPVLVDQFNWESFAHSVAATDHHAFGWFANHETLAIPSARTDSVRIDRDEDGYKEAIETFTEHRLHAFQIDTTQATRSDDGIVLRGTVDMDSRLLRSAYIDTKLYAIAEDSIKSAEITTPSETIAEVRIARPEDTGDPAPLPDPPEILPLRQAAMADMAQKVGLRPEEIMLVSVEAHPRETRLLLRYEDEHVVYRAEDGELTGQETFTYAAETADPIVWHNSANPLDTDGDGQISPRDALLAINAINRGMLGRLPAANVVNQIDPIVDPYRIDTNNDGHASAIDVLRIIRHLNSQAPTAAAASDAYFAQTLEDDDE